MKSRLGRGIVASVFAAVVAYFAVAILGSILVDLYGKPPPENTGELAAADRAWCVRTIVGLRDELDSEVTFIQHQPIATADPQQRWQAWTEEWVDHLTLAQGRCVGLGNPMLDRAYERLAALHAGYALAVESALRTRREVLPELQQAIDQLKRQR